MFSYAPGCTEFPAGRHSRLIWLSLCCALLEPIQQRHRDLMRDKDRLEEILAESAMAAQRRANRLLSKVFRKAGFVERRRA